MYYENKTCIYRYRISGYIFVSVYGILHVEVYFDRTKLINFDSPMTHFVELEDRLFRDKSFSIRHNNKQYQTQFRPIIKKENSYFNLLGSLHNAEKIIKR